MTTSTRPFRFGLQAFDAPSGKDWLDTARRAEDLGYTTLFTSDHYFGPGAIADVDGPPPGRRGADSPRSPWRPPRPPRTLRVGCRVFCCDFHHPVVLAKEMATLDVLSPKGA